ncbi:MAG TPA: hypothetical protein VFQ20_06920, partial [Burkholderiaceae bacterium]|nr:hypothetical protein [Burkholderiaceae bacterium]
MVKRVKSLPVQEPVADEVPSQRTSDHDSAPSALLEWTAGLPESVKLLATESAQLYGSWVRSMLGFNDKEVPAKDPRFSDPAWREHPLYRRLGLSYLAFCETVDRLADANPDWRKRERARFLGGVLTSTLAPTNTLLGNPAALKRAYETGGASLVQGAMNMVDSL